VLILVPASDRSIAFSRWTVASAAIFCAGISAIFFFATNAAAQSAKPAASSDPEVTIKRTGLLFASFSDDPGVHAPVKDGKKTVLAPAYEWEYGVRLFTPSKWRELGYDWNEYLKSASREADKLVDTLEPMIHRDSRGVIDYAEVTSDDPFLSSILLSKRFLPKFEDEFGPRLHAVILDRYKIFIFPADGGKLEAYGTALADAFRSTERPVSLEVFLIDEAGVSVIGQIGE
jgi:hypothetical protein